MLAEHIETIAVLLGDSISTVRYAAADMLGKLEPVELTRHAASIVPMLGDWDTELRYMAVETLGKLEAATRAHSRLLDNITMASTTRRIYKEIQLRDSRMARHAQDDIRRRNNGDSGLIDLGRR